LAEKHAQNALVHLLYNAAMQVVASQRSIRRRIGMLAAITAAVSLVAIPSRSSVGAAPAFTSLTPAQMLTISIAGARTTKSGTAIVQVVTNKYKSTQNLTVVANGGEQHYVGDGIDAIIRVIGKTCYLKENAAAIEQQFGVKNSPSANRWVAVPSSYSVFNDLIEGVSFGDLTSALTPLGKLTASKPTKIGKISVIGISGTVNPKVQLSKGTETVYISTTKPYLPVKVIASGSEVSAKAVGSVVITVSKWGSTPAPTVPNPVLQFATSGLSVN
jgi:hypothetical protein